MSQILRTFRFQFFIAWVLVMLCAHIGLKRAYYYDSKAQQAYGSSIKIDWDTMDFTAEIQRTPHFVDTLKWWHGPWMEKVPYFRPLTMTAFWTEYQIFGENGRVAFQWTHRLWHLAFLTLLLVFLIHIAGIVRATLSTAIFALGWNAYLKLPDGIDAFNCWKDQCDIWSIMATTAACLSLWRWLASRQQSEVGAKQWWKEWGWWRTFAFFVLGLTIKETGLLAPIYLALTLWMAGKLKRNWLCLWPFYAGSLAWWILRFLALGGWGNRTGQSGSWPVRFASQALGLPISFVNSDGLTTFALGIVVGLILLWLWRHDMKNRNLQFAWGGWLIAMIFSLWMAQRFMPEVPLNDILLRLIMPYTWIEATYLAFILIGFWLMFRQLIKGDRLLTFGWLWVVIGFLPLIVQPPTSSHVHYPIAPGWSLWLAGSSFVLFELAQAKIKARIKN